MAREAEEEAGIIVRPDDLRVVHAMHRIAVPNEPDFRERIDVFLTADEWEGEPRNMEPEKCDDLSWFSLDNLPENIIPCVKQALEHIKDNKFYSEFRF